MSAWTSRLAWLAAVLSPLGFAAAWRDAVARHPVLAALVTLVYWAALAVANVLRDLSSRWRTLIVDRLDHSTRRRLSRFAA